MPRLPHTYVCRTTSSIVAANGAVDRTSAVTVAAAAKRPICCEADRAPADTKTSPVRRAAAATVGLLRLIKNGNKAGAGWLPWLRRVGRIQEGQQRHRGSCRKPNLSVASMLRSCVGKCVVLLFGDLLYFRRFSQQSIFLLSTDSLSARMAHSGSAILRAARRALHHQSVPCLRAAREDRPTPLPKARD